MAPKPKTIKEKKGKGAVIGEVGGEVIKVQITLNNNLVYYRCASLNDDGKNYLLDDKTKIKMKDEDSYKDLAIEILKKS